MRRNNGGRLLPKLAKVFFALASCAVLVALATQLLNANAKGTNQPRTSLLSDNSHHLQDHENTPAMGFGAAAIEEEGKAASSSTNTPSSKSDPTTVEKKEGEEEDSVVKVYSYRIVKEYNHDHQAFTQGFLYDSRDCDEKGEGEGETNCKETFLESTGLNGQTSVRRVDLESGVPIASTKAAYKHFGEGLTRWKEKLIQLTWKSGTTLVYDYASLELLNETKTDLKDGWGLTNDETHLIATDSGYTLYFLDPETLTTARHVDVFDGKRRVNQLNELEYVEGEVWANVWMKNCVARIDPETGRVKGWILAEDLTRKEMVKNNQLGRLNNMDVLNGIAFDPKTRRIWFTGKNWSTVYQVEVVQLDSSEESRTKTKQCF